MDKTDIIKNEYESICASEELKERIGVTMKKAMKSAKRRTAFKWACAAACACIVLSIGAFNIFPSFAYALSDIPVLGSVIKVVTLGRYENEENGYSAKVAVPKIEGLLDKELEDKLNKEFKDNADLVISAYEKDVKELKKEFGEDATIHMGVNSDYKILTDNDKYLAIDVWILNIAGSSSTKHSFYNIDKKAGRLLKLSDMFKSGADYITPLSKYIKEEMIRRNKEEDGIFWTEKDEFNDEIFEKIKPDQNFYINNKGNIVICFDKYEIAAGTQGCPEFEIPRKLIKNIIKRK